MKNDKNKNELMSFSSEDLAEAIKNSVMDTLGDVSKTLRDLDDRMTKFENSMPVDYSASVNIKRHVSKRVHKLLGKTASKDYQAYSRTFYGHLWADLKRRFGVTSYMNIRLVDYDLAISFIDAWTPENGVTELKHEIDRIKAIQMQDKIDTLNRVAAGGAV